MKKSFYKNLKIYPTHEMRPKTEEKFKALLNFIDSNYLHSGIVKLDYLQERFGFPRIGSIGELFHGQLQTRRKDYIFKKKLDHAAEVLATTRLEHHKTIADIVGWPRRGGADTIKTIYGHYPWYCDFEALFTMRFGWRPDRWANIDMGDGGEENKWEDYRERYRQRRAEKMRRYCTHKQSWVDLWSLSDVEKRKRGMSFSEMYRERIYTSRNGAADNSFATSSAYIKSYFWRKNRWYRELQNGTL